MKKILTLIFTISFLMLELPLWGQVTEEWVQRYNGSGNNSDYATAIISDASGNIYVTGRSYGRGSNYDYATVKYDAMGNELWVKRYNGSANNVDHATAITSDASGNVYVSGRSYGGNSNYDYATVKYDAMGNELWIKRYNGPGNNSDWVNAIITDAMGNVYVTGRSFGNGSDYDYATVKYDAMGNELWVHRYNGPGNSGDEASDITTDTSGNVYVTGRSTGLIGQDDYVTIKYDDMGNEIWVKRYNGTGDGDDYAIAIAKDALGNVYVTGSSYGSGSIYDYATVKYDAMGNELWVQRYNGSGNSGDEASDITTDTSGNIFVSGQSLGSEMNMDYATVKYDGMGNELWVQRYNGPGKGVDFVNAIATDASGNVYVTGQSDGGSVTGSEYATVKYNAAGDELWVQRYDGEFATAITLDANDNVYLTGASLGGGSIFDYVTVKYSQGQDINPPMLIGVPDDVTVECGAVPETPSVSAEDNEDGNVTVTFSESQTDGACANEYTLTRTWSASDAAGNNISETQTITVEDNTAPTISGVPTSPIVVTTNSAEAVSCGVAVDFPAITATDNCSGKVILVYSNSYGTTVNSGDIFDVGTSTITVTATDACGNTAFATATVTVIDNVAPTITAPSDITVANDAGLCEAVVPLGLPTTSDNCSVQPATHNAPSTFPVGTTTVTWSVEDQSGNVSTATQQVTVTNSAPVILAISAPSDPVSISNAVTASVDYGDNNIATATLDWGDGASTVKSITSGSSGTFSSNHVYSMPGVYTLSVTLTDACGETVRSNYQYIIIYDPSGGFVTGGGWINSPAGALVDYPEAKGKANFKFVSKYRKGANMPSGYNKFQFKFGNMNFKSTIYEWLVVTGDKAKFKGKGTINGQSGYGFMVTATDGSPDIFRVKVRDLVSGAIVGSPDLFRVKIWDLLSGAVVYDNHIRQTDDSYTGTVLGGGSIVVHDGKKGKNSRSVDNSKPVAEAGSDIFNEEPGTFGLIYEAFPNPVLKELNLYISSDEEEEISFRAYDMVGRLIHESKHLLSKGDNYILLDTQDWEVASGKVVFQMHSPRQGVHWFPLLKE